MDDAADRLDYRELGRRLSNWGRWGSEDQLGTVNLITDEARIAAAALVRTGVTFSLAVPFGADGPQLGDGIRTNPLHLMTRTPADPPADSGFHYFDDALFLHLQSGTQLDGLAHVAYDGMLYNGHPVSVVTPNGATRLGVESIATRLHGRGVLLDIPRLTGRSRLEPTEAVSAAMLDRAVTAQGVEVRPGDLLFVRTGWITTFTEDQDRRAFLASQPGLSLDTAEWLKDRDVALVAADNWGIEVTPAPSGDEMPLHCVLIRDLGMPLAEMLDLERLADHAAETETWEFAATCAALPVTGGIGSALIPTVTF